MVLFFTMFMLFFKFPTLGMKANDWNSSKFSRKKKKNNSSQLRFLCQLRMYRFFHALLFGFITV